MWKEKKQSLYSRLNYYCVFNAGKLAVGACTAIYSIGYIGSTVQEAWYKGPTLVCLGLIALVCFITAVVITVNEVA